MSTRKSKLFVIGSINIDLSIYCEKVPLQGETIEGSDFNIELGGKGSNQAYYASSLGLDTTLIGNVGNDYYGDFALKAIKNAELKSEVIKRNQKTGVAIVINSENDNRIILDTGANKVFDNENLVFLENLCEGDFLLSQLEINEDFILKSFKLAKEKNVTTFLNPAPANLKNKELYKYIDYLVLNETEFMELLDDKNCDFEKDLHKFLNYGVKNIILTLGENGSIFMNDKNKIHQKAEKVKVVNTTGAGDSFIGSFIYKLSETNEINESLSYATKVSGFVCTKLEVQVKNIQESVGK